MRLLRILPSVFFTLAIAVCVTMFAQDSSTPLEVAALLERPSAVSAWQNNNKALTKDPARSNVNPLVAQAQIYARLLNPPKSTKPAPRGNAVASQSLSKQKTAKPQSIAQAMPQKVSPTFKVRATSVFAKHPEKSMALISKPGKGLSWIRPGDMLGYLEVVDIRKDAVVYEYKGTMGEVTWKSDKTPALPRPTQPTSALAMDSPKLPSDPVSPSPVSANPLASPLATPVRKMYSLSPRPHRGTKNH